MRLTTIISMVLLATTAQAAEMQSTSFTLRAGHVNAGSHADMAAPLRGSDPLLQRGVDRTLVIGRRENAASFSYVRCPLRG